MIDKERVIMKIRVMVLSFLVAAVVLLIGYEKTMAKSKSTQSKGSFNMGIVGV